MYVVSNISVHIDILIIVIVPLTHTEREICIKYAISQYIGMLLLLLFGEVLSSHPGT